MKFEPNECIVIIYGKRKTYFHINPVDIIELHNPKLSRSQIKRLIQEGSVKMSTAYAK